MTEMVGIRVDRTGDHFVLRSVKSDGTTTTMPLSTEEVATLAAMAHGSGTAAYAVSPSQAKRLANAIPLIRQSMESIDKTLVASMVVCFHPNDILTFYLSGLARRLATRHCSFAAEPSRHLG